MKVSIVEGCDAVDAGQDWVRLRVPGGALRTIPWSGIRMAALPPNNSHMTFEGDLAQITALFATHDALWIECEDGVDIALLEKTHPRRDSIVHAFQEHLESRWMGDRLSMEDAAMRLFKETMLPSTGRGIPKLVILAIAVMVLTFLLGVIVAIVKR